MLRLIATLVTAATLAAIALFTTADPLRARALAIAGVYLVLALSEVVSPFVPTLFLLVSMPLVLQPLSSRYQLGSVLPWAADPVLALFAGGFALGLAAERHGLDRIFAAVLVRTGGRSQLGLLAVVLLAAAGASMWLSNVAAAALLLTALSPVLASAPRSLARALLLALAVGANLGGMATPIGSGPNGIAIAATRGTAPITFAKWMSFGVPMLLGMAALAYVVLAVRYRVRGPCAVAIAPPPPLSNQGVWLIGLFVTGVVAWLTESIHGVSAPSVALALMLALFGTNLLVKADLGSLDWSTLGLIAGGLMLGRLLESTGILTELSQTLALDAYPRWVWLGGLVCVSAGLAALMSNTGTAAMLVPFALQLDPSPSTAILIAIATSFGMPFPISTPPNAMVYGRGELRAADLFQIGMVMMVVGCVLVTFTGTWFLALLGFE